MNWSKKVENIFEKYGLSMFITPEQLQECIQQGLNISRNENKFIKDMMFYVSYDTTVHTGLRIKDAAKLKKQFSWFDGWDPLDEWCISFIEIEFDMADEGLVIVDTTHRNLLTTSELSNSLIQSFVEAKLSAEKYAEFQLQCVFNPEKASETAQNYISQRIDDILKEYPLQKYFRMMMAELEDIFSGIYQEYIVITN